MTDAPLPERDIAIGNSLNVARHGNVVVLTLDNGLQLTFPPDGAEQIGHALIQAARQTPAGPIETN